ncbi:MAG: hypothetical protein ACTSR2_01590 [Candidatus Hodarchaeales archaeon]
MVDEQLLKKFKEAVMKNYEYGKIRKIIEAAMKMYIDKGEISG